jgi:hypothetical protein
MSGATVELIGRRPRDYFEYLPKPIRMRVIDRIRRAYFGHFPSLGEDFAQEACARLLASGTDLRAGPEPTSVPTQAWYDEAESALVRFATGLVMRLSVLRYHRHFFGTPAQAPDCLVSDCEVDTEGEDVLPRANPDEGAEPDDGAEGHTWIDEQLHWTKIVKLLRDHLEQQEHIDPAVLRVFDQLCRNAAAFECSSNTDRELTQDIVRGETFQINHLPLLQSLQRTYPEDGWDLQKLRLKIADLVRDALRVQEVLASAGMAVFGRNRETIVTAEKKLEHGSESRSCDDTVGEPKKGVLS